MTVLKATPLVGIFRAAVLATARKNPTDGDDQQAKGDAFPNRKEAYPLIPAIERFLLEPPLGRVDQL
jgi:hypothetical protein